MAINNDTRYVGTNWDDVKVAAKVKESGGIARKVITKGISQLEAGDILAKAFCKLRQGYEVRFVDELGDEAIRIYPCVSKGGETMDVCLRAMNGFKGVLKDKKVKRIDVKKNASAKDEREEEESDEVTPDTIATCPNCGHHFRVGKKK